MADLGSRTERYEARDRHGWPSPVTITMAAASAAALLGFWGATRLEPALSFGDELYTTLRLFYANVSIDPGSAPWQLEIARLLAPAVVLYAALATVFALTRDRVRRWLLTRFGRDHRLLVGLGARGRTLVRAARQGRAGGPEALPRKRASLDLGARLTRRLVGEVVAIERDRQVADGLRDAGAFVIVGDAREQAVLRRGAVHRAARIDLLAGDDTTNLEILAGLRNLFGGAVPIPAQVAIESPALWATLPAEPPETAPGGSRVRFVNVAEQTVRLLVDAALEAGTKSSEVSSVAIWGRGAELTQMAVKALRAPLVRREGASIVLGGEDAGQSLRDLRAVEPWAFDRADFRLAEQISDCEGASIGFVCGLAEAEALGIAAIMRRWAAPGARVFATVPDSDATAALEAAGHAPDGITLVPVEESIYGEVWLSDWLLERLARARHELYRRKARERGESAAESSMRPWEELDEETRHANYDFARGLVKVLKELDAQLVPLAEGEDADELSLPPETAERLARAEHDRWAEHKRSRGWSFGEERDDEAKRHPLLVPWESLPESEREKDRDSIDGLPEMLAGAGYRLELTDGQV